MSLGAPHNPASALRSSPGLPKHCAPAPGELLLRSLQSFTHEPFLPPGPPLKVTSPFSTCQYLNLYSRPSSATFFYVMGSPVLQRGTSHSFFWISLAFGPYLYDSIYHMDCNHMKWSFSFIRCWTFDGSKNARYTARFNDYWTHG